MHHNCKYGGRCIDPGHPSDCLVNSRCFNFRSAQEKEEFDNLPDKFDLTLGDCQIRFKTNNQLKFFLTDFPAWRTAHVSVLATDGTKWIINLSDIAELISK